MNLVDIIGPLFVGTALAYLALNIWARREGIAWALKAVIYGVIGFLIANFALAQFHRTSDEITWGSFIGLGVGVALTPKRSRYIRAKVRRYVIARDLKGERYDSRQHHIDHRWPFSRGGSNTADNLRVIPKKENLRKGAKKPRLRDWF